MTDFLLAAVPTVLATVAIGLMGKIASSFAGFRDEHGALVESMAKIDKMAAEHEALMESQRNQIKAQIVTAYQTACQRGYITPMELDTVNRMADSYFALGGNHYIHAIVKRMNGELPVVGEPVPTES